MNSFRPGQWVFRGFSFYSSVFFFLLNLDFTFTLLFFFFTKDLLTYISCNWLGLPSSCGDRAGNSYITQFLSLSLPALFWNLEKMFVTVIFLFCCIFWSFHFIICSLFVLSVLLLFSFFFCFSLLSNIEKKTWNTYV